LNHARRLVPCHTRRKPYSIFSEASKNSPLNRNRMFFDRQTIRCLSCKGREKVPSATPMTIADLTMEAEASSLIFSHCHLDRLSSISRRPVLAVIASAFAELSEVAPAKISNCQRWTSRTGSLYPREASTIAVGRGDVLRGEGQMGLVQDIHVVASQAGAQISAGIRAICRLCFLSTSWAMAGSLQDQCVISQVGE